MILSLLFGLAHAQDIKNGDIPRFNAQAFRPAVDSHQFLWLNDTSMGVPGTFNYRSTFAYTKSPVVYKDWTGHSYNLLNSVSQMDVSGGFTKGHLRYALSAPIILQAKGETVGEVGASNISEIGLGEMMADVKLQLLDRNAHRLGMAINARSSLPTSTTTLPLGTQGMMFEIEGGMDTRIGRSVLAVNLGHRHQPSVETEFITWGNQLLARVGYGYSFNEKYTSGMAVEYNMAGLYEQMTDDGLAMETMLSGWYAVNDIYQVRAGIAKGISTGMTTPAWRGVLSVSFLHKTEADTDEDGVADHSDMCPATPEDVDGFEDTDGCPEPTKVNVLVMDHLGHEIRDVTWVSKDGRFSGPGHSSFFTQSGSLELDINDPRYRPMSIVVDIQDQEQQDIVLEIEMIMGSLKVIVKDFNEQVIPHAIWSVDGVRGASLQPTGYIVPLIPGEHEVMVQAHGYRMVKEIVNIKAEEIEEINVMTIESKVTADLQTLERVVFKTNSHIIDERSYDLLDEVADVLNHHHRIEMVHIEGHTDTQGNDEHNKKLSQKRADEVMKYLIEQGIESKRLDATGFGEEKPIDTNDTTEGRANNRRIVFRIDKHHGDDYGVSEGAEEPTETDTQIEVEQSAPQ